MTALPSTLSHLSLREKIAQLVFVRIGSNLPPVRVVEQDEERIAAMLTEVPIGGLLLFNGGPDTKSALRRLQHQSTIPLLVASDIERGVGQQVKGHALFPHAMAFDKLAPAGEKVVAEFARTLASESHEVGIHITFGPVADVATNPLNPIIATRAFSELPARAAELTKAYVLAAESAGLFTTAKHFPGHGDTHQDSHDSLPSVERSVEQLKACELLPFQAAINAGCALIMTAHVSFPAIDPSGVPATLSLPILKDLLRSQMNFKGVVCSDSLLMAGVRDRFASEEEMAFAALNAGVDLLLDIKEPANVVDYLTKCVETGQLTTARVDEAFGRVWDLKRRAFATKAAGDDGRTVRAAKADELAPRIAHDAIEVKKASPIALPFKRDVRTGAILIKPFETAIDPPEQPLAAALREHFSDVAYIQIGPKSDKSQFAAAMKLAQECDQLVVAMIVRPAAWHAFGLNPEQKEFVQSILRGRDNVILVSLGVPYALDDYPRAAALICSYSDVPVSQQAIAAFLLEPSK
ncbi:MAG TPA: glycoside hydrolase family 3 N-terminal domain-containing protein [Lacipirellulaceae bacterium]|jgi:beta-glucosidase-like glycosyl hydrolase|nr:glycoside hydrolase family 3 N-terminal domain-containing protein [Lacipirellulaceae bacterium]